MQVKKQKFDSIWLLFCSLPTYLNISQSNSSLARNVYRVVFSSIIGGTEWLENCREIKVHGRETVTLQWRWSRGRCVRVVPISSVHIDCSTLTTDGFQRNRVWGVRNGGKWRVSLIMSFVKTPFIFWQTEIHFSVKKDTAVWI